MKLSVSWFDDVWRDARYAMRSLARNPGFTAVAILALSVGIGAAAAIGSLVSTILLRPLPFVEPQRLVRIVEPERPRNLTKVTYGEYLDWQARTDKLSGLAGAALDSESVMTAPAGSVRMIGGLVSANYFEVLGARAMIGRTLASTDSTQPDLIVLGYYAWKRHFAADPKAIGSVVNVRAGTLAGRSFTIVGIMPESTETIGSPMDYYAPIVAARNPTQIGLEQMIGRLRAGVSAAVASKEAEAIGIAIRPPRPTAAPRLTRARFDVQSLSDGLLDLPAGRLAAVASPTVVLRIFAATMSLVLLIVCANVAGLLLVRGTGRRRELATRLALGAGRGRLLRLVFTECLILAGAGGAVGGLLGAAGLSLIKRLMTIDSQGVFRIVFGENILPRANEIGIDIRVFGLAFAIAGLTTLVFGLLPAFQLSQTHQLHALGSRAVGRARRETRLRMWLVVGQVATATILLVGSALLATSFVKLVSVDKGYDPSGVMTFQLVLPGEYPAARKAESIDAVLSNARAIQGVSAAGYAYAGILIPVQNTVGSFVPRGWTLNQVSAGGERPRLRALSAGYLEATGAQLLAGRLINQADAAAALPVAVMNRTAQRRYFGDGSAVGALMEWHGGPEPGASTPVQVVGVIADVRQAALDREPYPEIFMDYRQVIALQERWGVQAGRIDSLAFGFMSFAVRTDGSPTALIPRLRQAIARADANAAVDAMYPLDVLVANSVARQRFYAVMLTAFACIAALLAAVGIYGMLVSAVLERTREIGVRMALGARPQQVVASVIGRGVLLSSVGLVLGLAGAAVTTRYLQAMLYGIKPLDPGVFLAGSVILVILAAFASYLPARLAASVDPIQALRSE